MFELPEKVNSSPNYVLPLGSIWEVDGVEVHSLIESKMFLRKLELAPNMLVVGAVLKRAQIVSGLHFNTPAIWSCVDDEVWVACESPSGKNMFSEEIERLSWSEALDCWRPFAEAVLRAHKRGVVVGNIFPFSIWYDSHLKRLTMTGAGCWIGDAYADVNDLLAPEYLQDGVVLPPLSRKPTFATDLWCLAKLLVRLVTKTGEGFDGIPAFAIDGLSQALQEKGRQDSVSDLLRLTTPKALRGGSHSDDSDERKTNLMYGRVHQVSNVDHEKMGKGVKFFVHYPSQNETGDFDGVEQVGTFFYENRGEEIYHSIKSIWEGSQLNLLSAKEISDSSGKKYLTAGPETLPVIEPHWLVSVTDILKAEGCVSRYFVDLRDMGEPSRPLVFGSLLHGILDDLSHSNVSFEDTYFPRLKNSRISMLAAGLGDEDLARFEKDARYHFSQIAGFARGRNISDNSRAGWTGEHVEVTRYSTTYGLEGRIDLVTEDTKIGLQIIELKSGSERDEHLSQLRCYRLLWDGVAQRRNLPIIGYLLYSKSGILRSAPFDDPDRVRRILRARNALLVAHRAQFDDKVESPLPYFMGNPLQCRSSSCRFRKNRCAQQTRICGIDPTQTSHEVSKSEGPLYGLSPEIIDRAWKHWAHFSKLLEMEYWEQGEQLGRVMQANLLWDRIATLDAVQDVRMTSFNEGSVVFEGDFGKRFQRGEMLLAHSIDLEQDHILRGRVLSTEMNRVELSAMGAPNAASLPKEGWILDRLPTRLGYRAGQRSLYRFLACENKTMFEVVFNPTSKSAKAFSKPIEQITKISDHGFVLNKRQKDAVQLALSSKGAAIIQGPPGTGKTTVIAHIVAELLDQGKRVLLTAQTNTAVDKVLDSLLNTGVHDFIRLGDSDRSPILCRELEERGLDPEEFFSRNIARNTASLNALGTRFKFAPIVACTTYGTGSDNFIQFLKHRIQEVPFDVVIVDEATQISEPMTLGALALGKRFVLVGDHRQLPPIVQSERATSAAVSKSVILLDDLDSISQEENEDTNELELGGLDRSLFERLINAKLPYVMLEEQYRMHEKVMAFSSRSFYNDKLVAHSSNAREELDLIAGYDTESPTIWNIIDPSNPVVFVNVEGEDQARRNEEEAEAIIEVIAALRKHLPAETSIGVVSPFRAQVHFIRTLLGKELGKQAKGIDVDTVERFQGSERDVILVSWVKTGAPGEFLADMRRLNVTLTRARKKLILFGKRSCLVLNPVYRELIQQKETSHVMWSEK